MITPMQRHIQEQIAKLSGEILEILPVHEELLMHWVEDKRLLKSIQSEQTKAELKKEMLPFYAGFIKGVIEQDVKISNKDADMFVCLLVWHIDACLIAESMPMAIYALKHKLETPDNYSRQLQTLIGDEVADRVLVDSSIVDTVTMQAFVDLLSSHDIFDQVRAKMYRALGKVQQEAGDQANAAISFQTAIKLHDKCGAKKELESAERAIKNAGAEAPSVQPDLSTQKQTEQQTAGENSTPVV